MTHENLLPDEVRIPLQSGTGAFCKCSSGSGRAFSQFSAARPR